jgi:hypothetical protein
MPGPLNGALLVLAVVPGYNSGVFHVPELSALKIIIII